MMMSMTEVQISDLLGYVAEPAQNKVPAQYHEHVQEMIMLFRTVEKQELLLSRNFQMDYWIDFLPWHSVN
jgi:hypothetical protein